MNAMSTHPQASPYARYRLCGVEDVPEGEVKSFKPDGLERIAVYKVAGQLYATQDSCTHGRASLAEGWLEGTVIGCPVHSGEFDIRTGRPLCFPATIALMTFPVWVEDETVIADLSAARPDAQAGAQS